MRYVMLIVVPLLLALVAVDGFAQSSESTGLKTKVEMLEKELSEIKGLLKQQVENDVRKDKELAVLKEEVQKKEKAEPAKETPQKEIAALKEEVKKEIASIKEEVQKNEQKYAYEQTSGATPSLPQQSAAFADKKLAPAFGGVYTKPFLRRFGRNTYLGGYMDFEYRAAENNGDNGFDQTRFIPFIYSDVSDRVKIAAEMEFEHGGISEETDGEVKLEFATVDFLITDGLNWRGGLVLSPLGKFNLVHDSPLQDLTERPLVDRLIIPTTLTDVGMGFFGSMYPSELSKLDYEIYVTNGVFHGLDADGTSHFEADKGIRETRNDKPFDDYNQSPAVVGRVNFSPFIGFELGGSAYTSRYDENNDNQMTITALDFAYQKGPFELVGEGAYAFIETDEFARAALNADGEHAGVADSMWGYYVEGRYHFMPACLKSLAPKFFTDNSTFTGVLRWDQIETSEIQDSGRANWMRNRITPGLNYRYTEDTVFKLDYQINMEEKDMTDVANNAFLFSVATYF